MTMINFSELRRAYIFVNIKPLDGLTMEPVKLKADTGADSSTISKETLNNLGYDENWILANMLDGHSHFATTASGDKFAVGIVQMPLINILGYEAKMWPFMILLDEDRDFSNLLGRDLLAGFNYTFNNDMQRFEIQRANRFYFISEKLAGQEINEINKEMTI